MALKDKQFKSYIFTEKKETCSGCGACAQVCAKSAISMQPDEEGFLFPVRDPEQCVLCGLCDVRCPEVTSQSNAVKNDQHCYVATTQEKKYYQESASIGICTMLTEYVLSQNGVVYGCYLDESDWTAYHICIANKEDINKIRNSKYLQSNTKNTYTEVKQHLQDHQSVLYIGTPCQIAGLKAYLHKDYENLYTVDLICHGVFSPKLMPLEVAYWEKLFKSKVSNFRFRSKRKYKNVNGGMVNFDIERNGRLKHKERYAGSSPTYHCFAYSGDGKNYNLRSSCYSCVFRSSKRYGDITVGDPWFIKNNDIEDSRLQSVNVLRSLYSTNTTKGATIMQNIQKTLFQVEIPFNKSFVQPAVKDEKREIPKRRFELFNQLGKECYGSLVERLFNCNLEKEHQQFDYNYKKNIIKAKIKDIIRKILWKK